MPLMHRLIRVLPWLLAVLLLASLTHFVAILILPRVATRDAYDRLAARGTSDHMTLWPAVVPGEMLIPFRDPETAQGVCFFDLTKAPVRLKARVEDGRFLALSFRTRDGRIFYAMTDRAALRDTIDIRLVTESQLAEVETGDDEEQGLPSELRLKAPTAKGLVVATALMAHPGDRSDAENSIKGIDCHPEPLPPP
jgi:uncharacterized membrane protein